MNALAARIGPTKVNYVTKGIPVGVRRLKFS